MVPGMSLNWQEIRTANIKHGATNTILFKITVVRDRDGMGR